MSNTLHSINDLLKRAPLRQRPEIVLLTGSSGCGKTFLCEQAEKVLNQEKAAVCFFDQIGVPSEEEMIAEYGSGRQWQEAKTHEWINTISRLNDKALVVFEGQYHPQYAVDACASLGIERYTLAVVTCSEDVWARRLHGSRKQPELVTEDMRNWCRILHDDTVKQGGRVIDTSDSDLTANLQDLANLIAPLLRARLEL